MKKRNVDRMKKKTHRSATLFSFLTLQNNQNLIASPKSLRLAERTSLKEKNLCFIEGVRVIRRITQLLDLDLVHHCNSSTYNYLETLHSFTSCNNKLFSQCKTLIKSQFFCFVLLLLLLHSMMLIT